MRNLLRRPTRACPKSRAIGSETGLSWIPRDVKLYVVKRQSSTTGIVWPFDLVGLWRRHPKTGRELKPTIVNQLLDLNASRNDPGWLSGTLCLADAKNVRAVPRRSRNGHCQKK